MLRRPKTVSRMETPLLAIASEMLARGQKARKTTPMVGIMPFGIVHIRRRRTARMGRQRARNRATLPSVIARVMQRRAQPVRKTTPTESRNRPRRTRSIHLPTMTRAPRPLRVRASNQPANRGWRRACRAGVDAARRRVCLRSLLEAHCPARCGRVDRLQYGN